MIKKNKNNLIIISIFVLVLVVVSPTYAFVSSGSTYTLDGGVVYGSSNSSGLNYSMSGAGEPIVGQSSGGVYSQSGGVFGLLPTPASSGQLDSGSSGARSSFCSVSGQSIQIVAYSYYNNRLTILISTKNPNHKDSLYLTNDFIDPKKPDIINILDQGRYILIFNDIKTGEYNLVLMKDNLLFFNNKIDLFSIKVNRDGNGVVGGPDSSIVDDSKNEEGLIGNVNNQETKNTSVDDNKSRSVDILPIAEDTTLEVCLLFDYDCGKLGIIFFSLLLILCIINMLVDKYISSKKL